MRRKWKSFLLLFLFSFSCKTLACFCFSFLLKKFHSSARYLFRFLSNDITKEAEIKEKKVKKVFIISIEEFPLSRENVFPYTLILVFAILLLVTNLNGTTNDIRCWNEQFHLIIMKSYNFLFHLRTSGKYSKLFVNKRKQTRRGKCSSCLTELSLQMANFLQMS